VIQTKTDPRWLAVALEHMDRVLVDHAHCEKKAAATAMALVASYPECERLVRRLSALAIEEIRHFRQIHRFMRARGLALGRDGGDPYVKQLLRHMRHPPEERMMDRLLVAGLIEARSTERLGLLGDALQDPELAAFYTNLARVESGHAKLFVELARVHADAEETHARLAELAHTEAEILASIPVEPRIH
jgi:tRNA-(ms[2]io[6]A)-hydroxylase